MKNCYTRFDSYLVYFWRQNLNFSESLEGIIVRFSKQSDRFPTFSESSNYLHNHGNGKDTFNLEYGRTRGSEEDGGVCVDSLPAVTVSLAASLLLVPALTLDWMIWMAHLLLSAQSSGKWKEMVKLLEGGRGNIRVQNLELGCVKSSYNVFTRRDLKIKEDIFHYDKWLTFNFLSYLHLFS